jgi:hypothetical protein
MTSESAWESIKSAAPAVATLLTVIAAAVSIFVAKSSSLRARKLEKDLAEVRYSNSARGKG